MNLAKQSPARPPGPDRAVAIDVSADSLAALGELAARYGKVVQFRTPGGRPVLFINDPAAVRRLLVKQHSNYLKGPGFERVEMLLGNGLIVSDGDTGRRSRTMIPPSFSRQNVHRLVELMIDLSLRRARAWENAAREARVLDVTQETSDFALELILRAIFGEDYERRIVADGDNPFAFLAADSTRDLSVVVRLRRLRELVLGIIAGRRAREPGDGFDFLGAYLEARDREGRPFTDRELLDEVMTLIVAGYETSAGTLNWCWYLLSRHPEAAEGILAEARAFGPDFAGAADDPALAGMPWTQQVIEEALRLYPPVWLFSRRARTEDALEGYAVPEGADIYLSPYLMHRDADLWDDPEAFRPERFGPGGPYRKGDRPYFPFSLGPRRCLGEYFSFLEMKIHLGMLVQRFRLEATEDGHPGLDLGINLRSRLPVRLRPVART